MGAAQINQFLSDLAVNGHVRASTQNQAQSALLFLYDKVLGVPFEQHQGVIRAERRRRLPLVLTRPEVQAVCAHLAGVPWLVSSLLYGGGLRVLEGLQVRVKDLDFSRGEVVVRDGKGQKDRVTVLPAARQGRLREHLAWRTELFQRNLARGLGPVPVPEPLARKYPGADRE
jgi:site-specific recombinase XerD